MVKEYNKYYYCRCEKYENINYMLVNSFRIWSTTHSHSSPGERNSKFSQNGSLSEWLTVS